MKKLTQISLLMLGLIVAFAGCDAAKDAMNEAKDKAADMANIDFGDFDMDGMKEKLAGVTDGFKDVTADNVDGLTSKLTELGESVEGMGIDSLPRPAKTAVGGVMPKFCETVKSSLDGISDEGILSKLKRAVDGLLEKMNGFM